jgi:predicted Zn-dependent protease
MRKIVAVLALLAAVGCGSPQKLTESQEYYVGRGVAANAIVSTQGLHEGDLEDYVNRVGMSIALASDRPETFKGYYFGVLKSDLVNAFAAPGGFIFVTTAALKKMDTEDELAGVLAHEVSHVNLRHPEDQANRMTQKSGVMDILAKGEHLEAAGSIFGGILGATGHKQAGDVVSSAGANLAKVTKAFGSVMDGFLDEVMVKGYGRESELAADAMAVDLMTRSDVRYDPAALKAFIAKLPKADRGAWSDHPGLEGRLQAIDEAIKKRGVKSAIDPDRTKRFMTFKAVLGQ